MDDDDFIPLSALQHYLYCPRQCALIHLERIWAENRYTAEGHVLHEKTGTPTAERRHGVRVVTAMPLVSLELGLTGLADVVEFHREGAEERPFPVEYKRGRPKAHRADEVQLCAQALCLESMLGCVVRRGALFYGQTRRRMDVVFDEELRSLTIRTIGEVKSLLTSRITPLESYEPRRCDACSLLDACQSTLPRRTGIQKWLHAQLLAAKD
jgi:CRISPR-associated exonuclease Cas4